MGLLDDDFFQPIGPFTSVDEAFAYLRKSKDYDTKFTDNTNCDEGCCAKSYEAPSCRSYSFRQKRKSAVKWMLSRFRKVFPKRSC